MIFKGYISSRPLNDNTVVDQSVQNMVIRNSCQKRGFTYHLSATEYGMKNCFLVLNEIFKDLKNNKYQGVAFYSLSQLPISFQMRKKIYTNSIFRGKIILFSLENMLMKNKKSIKKIEEIIKIQNSLKHCPKSINVSYN